MHAEHTTSSKSLGSQIVMYLALAVGSFLAAFALEVCFFPNNLIDGGIVGVAMMMANAFGKEYFALCLILINLPFIYLAYKTIGKAFVAHMVLALLFFFAATKILHFYFPYLLFTGETIEIVVVGGSLLGAGIGLIIRYGGCLDGTEILGIMVNRGTGFTVGQTVLVCNFFVFGAYGLIAQDWHTPLLSLITYMVASKMMDIVIVGLDETKSVLIISSNSRAIAEAIMHELGLGLTIMYGRGGFSGDEREILYVITERLQLADLKDLIYREDPSAFIAIENLHEVANGKQGYSTSKKKPSLENLIARILKQ
jgi:uncharacterized membrane-anchored protein YitT (DUF2179 family)